MRKKVREKQRKYYSSDGETFWNISAGTDYSVWFHARIKKNGRRFPDVISAQLEIPNSLFIFDKERI